MVVNQKSCHKFVLEMRNMNINPSIIEVVVISYGH